jgi:hypothetical protein
VAKELAAEAPVLLQPVMADADGPGGVHRPGDPVEGGQGASGQGRVGLQLRREGRLGPLPRAEEGRVGEGGVLAA